VYFSLVANGRIEGWVVRADGAPVSRTSVDAVPADLAPGERPDSFTTSPSSITDDNGRFSIDAILPGRYVVAVNARFGPRLFAPYPTTYFPSGGREDARIVELGEGDRQTGLTILVSPLPETTLTGVVVFDDDRPIAEANVTAAPVDHRGMIMSSAKTERNGAFGLRLLAGVSYLIRAGIRTENGFRQTETVVFVDQRLDGLSLSIVR
jgi:protocatechuate 3,4-dioxygenase beta subunit